MRTVDPDKWKRRARARRRPGPVEARLRRSWRDALRDYCRHTSLHGLNKLTRADLSKWDRHRQAVVFAVALAAAACAVSATWRRQARAPALQASLVPPARLPFPAVALCSTNAISAAALDAYAHDLYSRDRNSTYTPAQIRRQLVQFGALLTMAAPPVDLLFLQFLAGVEPDFNVTRLMFKLSMPCSEILIRCTWRGRLTPCEKLFAPRVTPLGFCCVFNSRYYPEDQNRVPMYSDIIGEDYGLSVVAQQNPDDFAFVRRPHIGFEVLVFDGGEYPLVEGGGVRLYPVEQNTSVLMALRARVQLAAGGCGDGRAACLARCRRRTLAAVCACRLHTLPPEPRCPRPLCSLEHLDCLHRHREKLIYYYPNGDPEPSLAEELQMGQDCGACAPDCTRRFYSAAVVAFSYSHLMGNEIFENLLTRNRTLVNSTTIRLFFASDRQNNYLIEVDLRLFELLAKLCGQWCALAGAALAPAAELLYHGTVRWRHHYRRRAPPPRGENPRF